MSAKLAIGFALFLTSALPTFGQNCSEPRNPDFYNGYTVRKIELRNPLNFIFLVRHRLQKIKERLVLVEGQPFARTKYESSALIVQKSVDTDDAFGSSLATLVVVTSSIANCHEVETSAKTVDVIYYIFSSDPIPSMRALPEKRQASVEEPATTAADSNTEAFYKIRPVLGYEDARRGIGGVDLLMRIPGQIFEAVELSASASATSRIVEFQLNGAKTPKLRSIERAEYYLSYDYAKVPANNLRLARGRFQASFIAFSKARETSSSRTLLRYGASVELGNQQSNLPSTVLPGGTVTNSRYGAFRAYAGITRTTRYSEAEISYGLEIGGTRLSDLSFAKHLADAAYSRRFPRGTHSPWDILARLSLGGLAGSRAVLLNDRFFGGNSVTNFVPGNSWIIPAGPIIRSIPSNRVNAGGLGGTSFYSTNVTIGKVIYFKPLVPADVEQADGFASGVEAAENTAEKFFADDYLSATLAFKTLALQQAKILKKDLDILQKTFITIRATETIPPNLDKVLKKAESLARLVQNIVRHASVPDEHGQTTPQGLVTLLNPKTSLLLKGGANPGLLILLPQLRAMVSSTASAELATSLGDINQHLVGLRAALEEIKGTKDGIYATDRAKQDMVRPREVIDTLRHEVNSYSFSLVGIFDAGRVWPDPHGTRYAIGAGGRFSVLNVNFTAGYAFNPTPRPELGQGRGAIVVSLTYTNLFR